ncbi:unnamed protein product [Medioppia subpectinata]|uniref:NR LBD domain-containing protein n=1 Tax=Medioppia subpectinata TaxID=1979941 RepID=A0A7R9PUC0_9ACAR|nr:unnamed protein product [Medioppia subpectinata]CAG2100617.1 unnamed protein product [Medioppia subpectinata]
MSNMSNKKMAKICDICGDKGRATDLFIKWQMRYQCNDEKYTTISDYNGINQLESKRIAELLIATNKITTQSLNSNAIIHRIKDYNEMITQLTEMNEQFIRQIIQFTKSLNGFNNICADDKYALMKYGGKDLMLIRSLKYYNKDITGFRIQRFISIWNYDDHIIIDLTRTTTISTLEIPLGIGITAKTSNTNGVIEGYEYFKSNSG